MNPPPDRPAAAESVTSVARPAPAGNLRERVRSLRLPEARTEPAPRRARLPWILCIILAGTTVVFAMQARQGSQAEPPRTPETAAPGGAGADPAKPIRTASSGDMVLESKGYITPVHQIQVSPKISGMVVKLMIAEGMRVKKGDVLAQLETVDYEADYNRARASLELAQQQLLELERGNRPEEIAEAKAELEECQAQREQLYLDWKRNVQLKTGNALAARDYEQAYGSFKAMDRRMERLRQSYQLMKEGPRKEKIDAARAEVGQAEADLAKAKWRLDNCTVRAPVSGTILTKKAEEGNIVNPIAFNISASLCEMADLSDLEVDLNIQERDIAKVFKGQACRVRPEAFPDRVYTGTVSRLMPIADRAKGAIPVRVKVHVPADEEGVYLKPDMGVIVTFLQK